LVNVCKQLIDLANENGGPDNITVIAVRFDGAGLSVASAGEGVGHQAYVGQSEGRATIPVDLGAVQAADAAANASAAPTAERPVTSSRRTPQGASPHTPPARTPGRPPVPGGRVPKGVLRLVFGAIALVIVVYLYFKLRG